MRQFDDYSVLASNIVQSQMVLVIPPMQEIRRDAEDQAIPACLAELKRLQLLYMDSTLQALLAFQSSSNVETLTAAILQSRQYHEQYALELARVLGVTLTPPPPLPQPLLLPSQDTAVLFSVDCGPGDHRCLPAFMNLAGMPISYTFPQS